VPLLAIDTASSTVSVGLIVDGRAYEAKPLADAFAAQRVLASVDEVLVAAGLSIAELARIIVGRGPGSFTGLRIGLATAQGLGAGTGATVVGVSTLAALLAAAPVGAVAVVDARRGEVFAEGPNVPPGSYAPAYLLSLLPAESQLVGDGAVRYAPLLTAAGHCVAPPTSRLHRPSAVGLSRAAEMDPGPPTALYLRAPDAVPR